MPIAKAAAILFFTTLISSANAAHLGDKYHSYRDLHVGTDYGSLFLNEGHFRSKKSRRNKDFIEVIGDGKIELPKQLGYCFVINHYKDSEQTEKKQTYKVEIIKSYSNRPHTQEFIERPYTPTDSKWSPDLPDLCVSGLRSVIRVELKFSSSDGDSFNRMISFKTSN